ncbi:MAG TPA: pseudouridine synthase [Vicinamibacteria bacterium]|nr:pseudouridine synthase [Vicinamibacteria bacterium]
MRPPRGAPGGRPRSAATGRTAGPLSLARALSKFGVCSRAEAARWIEAGRVQVDSRVVQFPARRIDPRHQEVRVDGRRVGDDTERIVLVLHKPVGYITSRGDPGGRPTVYDLLDEGGPWVFPVGRLDRDSSGLLLLTNDHRLGQRLTDPEAHVPKRYHARVRGIPAAEALGALREGVPLGDGTVSRPAQVRALGTSQSGSSWLEIVLTEGKNRQVRRMCASVGHDVEELVRVAVGAFELGDLAPGQWRQLSSAEVARLAGGA